jgi:4-methyl-5(b-hydroxyethyl)-thiazole monophosphate biosynthesis
MKIMIYIFLADGFEDLEAIAPVDILKRAGFDVKTVGISGQSVTSGAGIVVQTDMTIEKIKIEDTEAIILPGGMPGTANLDNSAALKKFINYCAGKNILIGAICAAPMILGKMHLLRGKEACCFPGFEKHLSDAKISDEFVCQSGNIVTAKGPGAAIKFALTVVECLLGKSAMEKIKKSIQYC